MTRLEILYVKETAQKNKYNYNIGLYLIAEAALDFCCTSFLPLQY